MHALALVRECVKEMQKEPRVIRHRTGDVADGDNVSMATRIVAIAGSLAFDPNAGEANCRVRGLFLCPA